MEWRAEAVGHRNIRATHGKTLEWTRDEAVTPRATCVLGVRLQYDEDAMAPLHGPIRIEITADGWMESLEAVANPYYRPGDPFIVRRSDQLEDAVAVMADRAAADLPRDFARVCAQPGRPIAVRLVEEPDSRQRRAVYLYRQSDRSAERDLRRLRSRPDLAEVPADSRDIPEGAGPLLVLEEPGIDFEVLGSLVSGSPLVGLGALAEEPPERWLTPRAAGGSRVIPPGPLRQGELLQSACAARAPIALHATVGVVESLLGRIENDRYAARITLWETAPRRLHWWMRGGVARAFDFLEPLHERTSVNMVLEVSTESSGEPGAESAEAMAVRLLDEGKSGRDTAATVAERFGMRRNQAYRIVKNVDRGSESDP